MKLFCANYESPDSTQGTFESVFIEDVSYELRRSENLFKVKFEMYHIKNEKRIKLDESEVSFKGSNADLAAGLPTSNRTTVLRVYNQDYDPEILQYIEVENPEYNSEIPETIANPDYDENIEGSLAMLPNPEYIFPTMSVVNPEYVPETEVISMLKYLYAHEGQMPEHYDVIEYGHATAEDSVKYFTGGELTSPELFVPSEFGKAWVRNCVQMKGRNITDFQFID